MSEMYEGIVFCCSSNGMAIIAFQGLTTPFRLRLVRLADGTFGIYRAAGRFVQIDAAAITSLAAKLSERVPASLAVIYDNRSGLRAAAVYRAGTLSTEFGEEDEQWALLDEDGNPRRDVPTLRVEDLDDDEEYDCVQDAIQLGLAALGVGADIARETLKDAFCYDRLEALAETG